MICKAFLALSLTSITTLVAPMFGDVSVASASEQDPTTLILAGISEEPSKILRRFQPLADYLATQLQADGISIGEVKVAPDLDTMTMWMANGEVDLYFDSLYPAMVVADRSGGEPILRRWKDGIGEYHSIFFARADSGLTSLNDLQGNLIAFEEPLSTSSYMVPLAYLKELGFTVTHKELDSSSPTVAANEIGYLFSGEDQNTIQWVITGKVAAGVTDNGNYLELPEATREGMTILAETEALPRQVVMARPNMDKDLQEGLISILMDMDEEEAGQVVLEDFKTARFDNFPEGLDVAMARMRQLYELITTP